MNRLEEAVKAYDKAIELYPERKEDAWVAWENKAQILMQLGKHDESLEAYDEAIAQSTPAKDTETRAFVCGSKGMSLDEVGRYEEAVSAYDKALETSNEQSHAYLPTLQNKGMALLGMGNYEEALKTFDKVIEIDPNFGGWYGKGQVLNALGRYNESIAAFDKDLKQYPDNPPVWADKGEALQALGRNEDAIKAYNKVIETARSSPSFIDEGTSAKAWYNKSISLKALGSQAEADEAYAKAKELGYQTQEDSVDHRLKRGQELYDNGSYEESNTSN